MAAKGITIKIRADVREAEKAMAAMTRQADKVKNLEKEWAGLKKEYDAAGKAAEKAANDVDKAFAKLQAAQKEQAAIAASLKEQFNLGSGIDTSAAYENALAKNKEYQKATAEVAQLQATVGQLHEKMSAAEVDQANLASQVSAAEQSVAQERQELGRLSEEATRANRSVERMNAAFARVKSALTRVGKSAKSALKALLSMASGSDKTNNSFTSGIKTILKYALGIRSLYILFNKLRSAIVEGFKNLAQYSTECNANISALMSSLTQLKNSLATAFSPILTVITPALTALIDKLSTAITYVGMLFAALSGAKSFTKAKAVTEDYAASLGEASEAAEEAKRTFSFDKLNQLGGSNKQDSGSGAGKVDPSEMFETVEIEPLSFDSWGEAFSAFLDSILNDGIPRLREGLLKFASWLNTFSANLYEMFTFPGVAEKVAAIGQELAYAFNDMVNAIDWATLGGALGAGLNLALLFLVNFIYSFDWMNLGASIATMLNSAISEIDWYSFGLLLWAKFKIALETLAGFLLNLDIAQLYQAASRLVIGFADGITETILNIDWAGMADQLVALATGFFVEADWAGMATAVFTTIGAAFGAAAAFLWELIQVAWENVITWWHDVAFEDGEFTIEGLLDGILSAISGIGTWIYEHIFLPFINGFKAAFGIASPSTVMAEMGGYIIAGLKNGLTGLWSQVSGIFTEAIDGIKQTFSLDNLKEIGVNAVTGLMNGLKTIGSKAVEWGSSILTNIKDALGIHSPSTETEAVGEYTVAGYINGLNAYAPSLQATLIAMTDKVIALFKQTAENLLTLQTNTQNKATASLNTWMSTVKSLFTSFYANLTAQTDSWAKNLQSTLDSMVASAKAAAASIAAALSSAKASSAGLSNLSSSTKSSGTGTGSGSGSSSSKSSSSAVTSAASTAVKTALSAVSKVLSSVSSKVKVPAYATGSVLPANHPHLAIVGDQHKGTNIETQLSTMKTAFKQAMSEMGGGTGSGRALQIDLYLDTGVRLGRAFLPSIEEAAASKGVTMTAKG